MESLIKKYCKKLYEQGLTKENNMIFGARDDEIIWNRTDNSIPKLTKIFNSLNINALLFARPARPYSTILDFLTQTNVGALYPKDCETRTFIHDLPIAKSFDEEEIVKILSGRKSVIIPEQGIMTFGTVGPEQAFTVFSSVCFASFVKFFSDYLQNHRLGKLTPPEIETMRKVKEMLPPYPESFPPLMKGPFSIDDENKIYQAICEVGKMVVDTNLVDSFFGNISYFDQESKTLYIGQTGSSLDELEGCIDPCPIDNSSCIGITASSEFSAHKEIILGTDTRVILDGHPKFSVILSMDCDNFECDLGLKGLCHIKCPEIRFVNHIPIVPGEVGRGRYGLVKTVPKAFDEHKSDGVIVFGHGVFTISNKCDYNESFERLINIEKHCRDKYFDLIL